MNPAPLREGATVRLEGRVTEERFYGLCCSFTIRGDERGAPWIRVWATQRQLGLVAWEIFKLEVGDRVVVEGQYVRERFTGYLTVEATSVRKVREALVPALDDEGGDVAAE